MEDMDIGCLSMCQNIDFPRTEEDIDEKGDEIGEVHREIFLLEKDKFLYDMNENKLEVMKNETS